MPVTIVRRKRLTCAVCGSEDSHQVLLSTNSMGEPDLDFRPAGHMRDAVDMMLMECEACGYCALNLSEATPETARVVASDVYRKLIKGSRDSRYARRWKRWSLALEANGDRAGAGHAALHAAWASEDGGSNKPAAAYRGEAIRHFLSCAKTGISFAGDRFEEKALLVDLFRRTGQFEHATTVANELASLEASSWAREVAAFQLALLARQDVRKYSVAEARSFARSPGRLLEGGPRTTYLDRAREAAQPFAFSFFVLFVALWASRGRHAALQPLALLVLASAFVCLLSGGALGLASARHRRERLLAARQRDATGGDARRS